jgi:hypothetical protein
MLETVEIVTRTRRRKPSGQVIAAGFWSLAVRLHVISDLLSISTKNTGGPEPESCAAITGNAFSSPACTLS